MLGKNISLIDDANFDSGLISFRMLNKTETIAIRRKNNVHYKSYISKYINIQEYPKHMSVESKLPSSDNKDTVT